jgi:hypothetical protein
LIDDLIEGLRYILFMTYETGALLEAGEPNRVLGEAEGGIDILHEAVTKEPNAITKSEILSTESANALGAAFFELTKIDVVSTDGPFISSSPLKGNFRDRIAREAVQALEVAIKGLGAVDGSVESLDVSGRTVHDSGAGVDDSLELRNRGLTIHGNAAITNLPKAGGAGEFVVFNTALVMLLVGTTEIQLGAGLGKLEGEGVGNLLLLDGGVKEGLLSQVADSWESKTENTRNLLIQHISNTGIRRTRPCFRWQSWEIMLSRERSTG